MFLKYLCINLTILEPDINTYLCLKCTVTYSLFPAVKKNSSLVQSLSEEEIIFIVMKLCKMFPYICNCQMDYSPGTFCTLVTNFYSLWFRICYYLQTPSEIGYRDRQQLPPFDKYWILTVYLLENMLLENSILSLVKKLKFIWGKRLE